jgi:hypothetical protein
MYSPFRNSVIVRNLEKANDIIQIGTCKEHQAAAKAPRSNKRSRGEVTIVDDDNLFKEIVEELDYAQLFPTFRTLVLERFYILLSYNTDHEYYEDIVKITAAFKFIIATADKMYYDSQTVEEKQQLYYYLTDELKQLLFHAQQITMLFHLSARSP